MEKIGYSIVDANGTELQKFGDTKGQLTSPPNMLILNNGDHVFGFKIGDTFSDGSKFVERWIDDNPPEGLFVVGERDVSFDGTKVIVTVVYETRRASSDELVSYAANKRYEKEVGGITVSGIGIATDERSKQMILGARVAADADPNFTTPWVGTDGSVTVVTATQMIGISNAVLVHVATCFATYASVKEQIDNGTITDFAGIDAAFT